MSRFVVAARFAWDEYPGLRPGRLASGQPDLGRHPLGEAHLVAGPEAVETLCGLPRTGFPHDFPVLTHLAPPDGCPTCGSAGA